MTVNELISELQALTPEQRELPVEVMVWQYSDSAADGYVSKEVTHSGLGEGCYEIWTP